APPPDRRRRGEREPGRFRPLLFPQRRGARRTRQRPLLLPAEAAKPPRSPPLERCLRLLPGAARHCQGNDPGNGAGRDAAGGLRDGRNPLRAARPRRRPQCRPLGLHLQRHQDLPRPPRHAPAGSGPGDDDRPLHARLCAAACQDLPQAGGARDRRHVRLYSVAPGRRGERDRFRPSARRQAAGSGRRLRWDVGRPPGSGAGGAGGVRRRARRPTAPESEAARRCPGGGRRPDRLPRPRWHDHRGRRPRQRQHRPSVPRQLVAGHRRSGHLQPDGRCRDRRDLPRPALAVAAQRRDNERRPGDRRRVLRAGPGRGTGQTRWPGGRTPRHRGRPPGRTRAGRSVRALLDAAGVCVSRL
ncbi:MAG: Malate synthase, partial [uncultured Thermomicrobiales bacterium]